MGNKCNHDKNTDTGPELLNSKLYLFMGMKPTDIRRDVCTRVKRIKQMKQENHSLVGFEVYMAVCTLFTFVLYVRVNNNNVYIQREYPVTCSRALL